ncbi:MAG: hypothetical protein AAFN63_04670 [Pseudomonadota bacterium]
MNAFGGDAQSLTDFYQSISWAIGPVLIAALILFGLRLWRWFTGQARRPSENVPKTVLARLDGGMPADLTLITSIGRNAAAQDSLGEVILRPTIGTRLLMFGFPVLLYFVLQQVASVQTIPLSEDPLTLWFGRLLFILIIHNIIYFSIYELRYDGERITHLSWFYRRVELDISTLLSIRDDGMYFYILRSENHKKAYIPKHLTGIEDFQRVVRAAIAKNDER